MQTSAGNKPKKTPSPKWMNDIASMCGFETLETRNSDRHDFRDVSVWNMKAALQAAYDAGKASK